jgi:hypothetical protein
LPCHLRTMAKKRPRDISQLARRIVDIATGQAADDEETPRKRRASKAGKVGGRVTPAMEAAIADHVWTLDEIVGLLGSN